MRFNKQELTKLASLTSQKFDREGILILKERQDRFFRRSEGSTVRWFRLRGNLLFYLKGPEPWYEPTGVIVLGRHQVKELPQDENGLWPFVVALDNGVNYRMATFHESECTLWLKAIKAASYDTIRLQANSLQERLNRIRPVMDITTYRLHRGIVTDMNEVPLCELALSCDNLLCDAYGKPPSPVIMIYIKLSKALSIKYNSTEIVQSSSNPCFSKTILFRTSDGLTGDTFVKILVYDVKELVSGTLVPMGFTALQLSTIQEAQRLRVALKWRDDKTVGFVTINGWSLEPSYIGTSPGHTNDKTNNIEIPHKVPCHRRSHSLPPRLGLKLKFPSYGNLIKHNFVNSHQVTYRFHSGLGGDITVHEIMAEPKICYHMPIHLLDIYIEREKELLDQLLSLGDLPEPWNSKQLELASSHMTLLKHYSHARRCMQHVDTPYFKPSAQKASQGVFAYFPSVEDEKYDNIPEESSLEFAPVNLHLQRMWVHNDTLNKTGFHDIITAGAFAAHSQPKSERTGGGLIRLVQQAKDLNDSKAALHSALASKVQADYDTLVALQTLRDQVVLALESIVITLQARQRAAATAGIQNVKVLTRRALALWQPLAVEGNLSTIGLPKKNGDNTGNQSISTITRLTEQITKFDASDYEMFDSTSCSSKENSPTEETPSLSSSVPNICPNNCVTNHGTIAEDMELNFHNDYFNERDSRLNHSFRSVKSVRINESLPFERYNKRAGSLRHDFKSTASLEQVSYKSLMNSLNKNDKRKASEFHRDAFLLSSNSLLDPVTRQNNVSFFKGVGESIESAVSAAIAAIEGVVACEEMPDDLENIRQRVEDVGAKLDVGLRYQCTSHAALRLRCEPLHWTREHAALQMRRDACFSQALTTVTAGLLCWLCSVPGDTIVKLLSSGLGPLCAFEGLLSLYAAETAMWGDMVVAIEDLQAVLFTLTKVGHSNMSIPQVTGTRGDLKVQIPISDSLFAKFTNKEHLSFTITAVFFNIGINAKATLAEALGETTPQYHSNSDNQDRLSKYYYKYSQLFGGLRDTALRASSRTKPLEEVMENISTAVLKKVPKNVEVLHLAALATRLMNGIRFTSCKSAKDRTGMSVTLEQCSILGSEYHLAEHEITKALSIMRREGCRIENTQKNIGVRKFAFTKKQRMALPPDYRPPSGTYGSTQT